MRHVFIIDPLEKLVIKKDSTLLLAHTLSARAEVLISFEKDWFFESGRGKKEVRCYQFDSELVDGYHLKKFETTDEQMVELNREVLVHMRKDPPFDRSYLHMCWILQEVVKTGAKVINDPSQLLMINEKLIAYADPNTIPTLISRDVSVGVQYADKLRKEGHESVIIKPLDLYQGIGVQKVNIDNELSQKLEKAIEDYQGVYVMQPFVKKVEEGEIRSVFFANQHIGSIIKINSKHKEIKQLIFHRLLSIDHALPSMKVVSVHE